MRTRRLLDRRVIPLEDALHVRFGRATFSSAKFIEGISENQIEQTIKDFANQVNLIEPMKAFDGRRMSVLRIFSKVSLTSSSRPLQAQKVLRSTLFIQLMLNLQINFPRN